MCIARSQLYATSFIFSFLCKTQNLDGYYRVQKNLHFIFLLYIYSVLINLIKIDPNVQPVKQALRRMRIELEKKVIIQTKKLIEAGFTQEENHDWVASSVPMKKNGQICIFVDFRDLNKACSKDEFSLPVTEILIDHTSIGLRVDTYRTLSIFNFP